MAFESLRHWVKKEPQKEGRAWFSPTEEQDIVEALKISAQLGQNVAQNRSML